jgi:hypothetical protein
VTWLSRLIHRDDDQGKRLKEAEAQRDEAAELLAESREVAKRNRRHVENNHFGEGFRAAFAANDRRERHV